MSAGLEWACRPSAPEPSPDDASDAERRAWRLAYRLAAAEPGVPVTVWKARGEWLVLKPGQPVPPRARSHGTLTGPFSEPVRYTILHPDGRVTQHQMPNNQERTT
jgi:hypothetical protein